MLRRWENIKKKKKKKPSFSPDFDLFTVEDEQP